MLVASGDRALLEHSLEYSKVLYATEADLSFGLEGLWLVYSSI